MQRPTTDGIGRGKRALESGEDEQPERKRPALASVIVEALKLDSLQKLCSPLEPILRRVVSEEVEHALAKLGPARLSGRSMVSCITLNSTSRVALASCRNAFTMAVNLSLYAVTFIVFSVINGKTYADIQNQYRHCGCISSCNQKAQIEDGCTWKGSCKDF